MLQATERKLRNPRLRPGSRSWLIQQLFDKIQASGLVYQELEQQLGWTRQRLSKLLRGKNSRIVALEQVAELLGYQVGLRPIGLEKPQANELGFFLTRAEMQLKILGREIESGQQRAREARRALQELEQIRKEMAEAIVGQTEESEQ